MQLLDDNFLRAYRNWLLEHNDLYDCGYLTLKGHQKSIDRMTDGEIAAFRNERSIPYVEREVDDRRKPIRIYRSGYQPSLTSLAKHLVHQGDDTVYMTNSANKDVLLMLADLDNKEGTGDANGAADYLVRQYLGPKAFVEVSTGGLGRSIYFLLDVKLVKRLQVWDAFEKFAQIISDDVGFQGFGCVFGGFYGLPTIWHDKREDGFFRLLQRGNCVRLPNLLNLQHDLDELRSLPVKHFDVLPTFIEAHAKQPPTICKGDMRRTYGQTSKKGLLRKNTDHPDAFIRTQSCVSFNVLRTENKATPEEILADYHENYHHTGMTPKDVKRRLKRIEAVLGEFSKSYQPTTLPSEHAKPFKKDQYLDLVKRLVPEGEFKWKRREALNHERLSDFVSVKIQDAFFCKNNNYFGSASRDATVKNFRALRAKQMVNWTCTTNQYTKLLGIAKKHKLLQVYEEAIRPVRGSNGQALASGVARIIGPGDAMPMEKREFVKLYEDWKRNQQVRSVA